MPQRKCSPARWQAQHTDLFYLESFFLTQKNLFKQVSLLLFNDSMCPGLLQVSHWVLHHLLHSIHLTQAEQSSSAANFSVVKCRCGSSCGFCSVVQIELTTFWKSEDSGTRTWDHQDEKLRELVAGLWTKRLWVQLLMRVTVGLSPTVKMHCCKD